MNDEKDQRSSLANASGRQLRDGESAGAGRSEGGAPNEQQGWEAYRKWLSRVSMQPARRAARDVSIYSWRGYKNWADKVRQNWDPEES